MPSKDRSAGTHCINKNRGIKNIVPEPEAENRPHPFDWWLKCNENVPKMKGRCKNDLIVII